MAVKLQTQSATDLKHPRKQHQIEVEMHTPIKLFHEFQRWSLLTRMLFVLGIPTIFFLYATSPQVVTDQTNPQYRNNGLFDVEGNVKLQIYTEHIASLEPSAIQYILKKPLFSPERRPPTPEKETPIYPIIIETKAEDDFHFVGTIGTLGSITALVVDQSNNRLLHVNEGQFVRGWHFYSIEPNMVKINQGDNIAVMRLFECLDCS